MGETLWKLERYMEMALDEAQTARDAGELGIGAAFVIDGEVVCVGRSRIVERGSALAHAELDVLTRGQPLVRRGVATALVTTVEPCLMCLGAALRVGVAQIAFGAPNPRAGIKQLASPPPRLVYTGGILESRAAALLG
jgi:tRNA(adenine34) deaminase